MNNYIKTGIFICELRKTKGLSQEELGARLHVTKKAVSRWETGRGLPDSALLLTLSEILGVSVDEILKGRFNTSPEMDDESKQRVDDMNAVFEYLKEKKLLGKTLAAYIPAMLIVILGIIRITVIELTSFEPFSAIISVNPIYVALFLCIFCIFLIFSVMLFYRFVRIVYMYIKIK